MYEACSGRYAEQRAGSEDDALEVVASMISRIRESGVLPLQKMSLGEKMSQAAALSRLAQPPTNRMLAEALTHEVFTAFLPTLQRFQADLQAAEPDTRLEPLLQRLCESYNTVYDVLAEWCQQLCVPEAAEELHVRLRCALLQPDLLTLEAPPGRAELLRFLRQHAMTWLEQRQQQQQEKKEVLKGGTSGDTSGRRSSEAHATSSAAASHRPSRNRPVKGDDSGGGTDDVVMRCLHGLTLSRTRELRQLWQSVLETCIEARVSAQADDDDDEEENVSVHTLPACLAWHESVVHHFVHMALPLPRAHNTNSLLVLPQSVGTTTTATRGSGRGVQHERRLSSTSHTMTASVNDDGVSAIRAARAEWCAQLRQKLLTNYARRRLAVFWDLLVDYPDSTPVLEDVRYCLQACPDDTLRNELIHTVRHLLAARLHRAGTRTEDILSVLSKTIHSLCVLLPRSEQSSVIFSVVSDTLDHLRRRKDCVSTIVKAITQPRSDVSLFDGSTPFAAAAAATENASIADDDEGIDSELDDEEPLNKAIHDDMTDEEDDETPMHTKRESTVVSGRGWRRAGHAKPDVLRVLLTAIRVKVLAQEYQQVLAEQLLTKPMHSFDVSAEEEVLERLKCVFGEEALTGCVIMLHDVERSRRITTQLRDMLKQRATRHNDEEGSEDEEDDDDDEPRVMAGRASMCLPARRSTLLTHTPPPPQTQTPAPPTLLPAEALSLHVLSMTAWPRLTQSAAGTPPIPEHFTVHPALQSEMDRIARVYREVKVNRKLVWLCAQGHVELELMQQQASSPSNLRRQLRDKASCEGCAHGEEQGDDDDEKEGIHDTGMRPVTYTLSLFAASIVLFVKDLEAASATRVQSGGAQPAVTVAAVAAKMRIAENVLQPHLAALMPAILTYDKAGGLIVQTHAVTVSGQFVFDEAAIDTAEGDTGATNSAGGSSATPAGLSAEQLKMLQLMIAAMLKAGGPKSVNEIHNSMKIFGQFTGTVAEMKRLLLQLVSSGTLVMDGSKQLFSLPPH